MVYRSSEKYISQGIWSNHSHDLSQEDLNYYLANTMLFAEYKIKIQFGFLLFTKIICS